MTLGRNLNVAMLAEGVETVEQLQRLNALGCAMAQGYLFSPAVDRRRAERMVDADFGVYAW